MHTSSPEGVQNGMQEGVLSWKTFHKSDARFFWLHIVVAMTKYSAAWSYSPGYEQPHQLREWVSVLVLKESFQSKPVFRGGLLWVVHLLWANKLRVNSRAVCQVLIKTQKLVLIGETSRKLRVVLAWVQIIICLEVIGQCQHCSGCNAWWRLSLWGWAGNSANTRRTKILWEC